MDFSFSEKFSHSCVDLLLSLGSLSCCTSPVPAKLELSDILVPSDSRILWPAEKFIVDSMTTRGPGPVTAAMSCLCWYVVFGGPVHYGQTFLCCYVPFREKRLSLGIPSKQVLLVQSFSNFAVIKFKISHANWLLKSPFKVWPGGEFTWKLIPRKTVWLC